MAEASVRIPSWAVVGRKLRWYSQSQKKHVGVKCTQIDEKKRALLVAFDADKSATKIVPFSQLGRPECPLSDDPSNVSSRKSKDAEDGDKTPDWWASEKTKILDRSGASHVEKTVDEQLRKAAKEEEKREEARHKQALIEMDKKQVEEAFERRKRDADSRRLKEEEDWRNSLKKRRLEEEALDREKKIQKEAKRLKKDKEKRAEAQLAAIQASNVAAWGLYGNPPGPPGMGAPPIPFGAPLPPGSGPPLPPGAGPPLPGIPHEVLGTGEGAQQFPG